MVDSTSGYVYVLTSQNTGFIKIGGSDYPPTKRIKEINNARPYSVLGPWTLHDFRQVDDWRALEKHLHYMFRSQSVEEVEGQRELFRLSPELASSELNGIDPSRLIGKPKIDRMFQDVGFSNYIQRLFAFTGLLGRIDCQGAWTFVLFPGTGGGRYFTISIGPHEVAYSTLGKRGSKPFHMVLMDKLILDFKPVIRWVEGHDGKFVLDQYASALSRSVAVTIRGTFEEANGFFEQEGVRRAVMAYWSEALIGLNERTVSSPFARYHNWNAIAELCQRHRSNPLLRTCGNLC